MSTDNGQRSTDFVHIKKGADRKSRTFFVRTKNNSDEQGLNTDR